MWRSTELAHSIDRNILDLYTDLSGSDREHLTRSCGAVERLTHLCIAVIAKNWLDSPVTSLELEEDTGRLVRALSCAPLPLPLLVARLPHDFFWREAYKRAYHIPVSHNTCALTAYLERYTRDYLERLHPKDYDPQQVSELVAMCGQVLRKLEIRRLVAGAPLPTAQKALRRAVQYRDVIPLGSVLSGLCNLVELSLSLGLYIHDGGYCPSLRKVSPSQLQRITQGLLHCKQLQHLSITRSDIDCDKINILIEALGALDHLKILNLSHCTIGDRGALALSTFLLENGSQCKELILTNNKIGPSGVEGLAYALCQPTCRLLSLDLSCNTNMGVKGVKYLLTAIVRGTLLNRLNISACGVHAAEDGVEVAGVMAAALASGRSPLRELDISNNYLGQESGGALLAALETRGSSGLTVLRVRSCSLGRWEAAIQRATLRTAARRRAAQLRFKGGARRLLQAKRIARAIGIDEEVDPFQLARQLTARPSAASLPLSITLSLSVSLDLLLQDLPSSAREVLHVEIPPLKNPLCRRSPTEVTQRRFTYPSLDRKPGKQITRRGSEFQAQEPSKIIKKPTTNIAIHLKRMH